MKSHGFVCFSCTKVVVMVVRFSFLGGRSDDHQKPWLNFFFEFFAQKVGMLPTRNDFRGSKPQKTETFPTEHVDLAWFIPGDSSCFTVSPRKPRLFQPFQHRKWCRFHRFFVGDFGNCSGCTGADTLDAAPGVAEAEFRSLGGGAWGKRLADETWCVSTGLLGWDGGGLVRVVGVFFLK